MTLILTLLALLLPQGERPVILAVGDSMTAGYGVAAEQSYPAQLEDELAKAEGVTLIPFLEDVQGQADLLISDGRHPNGEGYAVVVRNILKVLEPSLERFR